MVFLEHRPRVALIYYYSLTTVEATALLFIQHHVKDAIIITSCGRSV